MIRRPPRSTLFPSRRSSDLVAWPNSAKGRHAILIYRAAWRIDRKSTRLNSSHLVISYAVFCLKKKKKKKHQPQTNSKVTDIATYTAANTAQRITYVTHTTSA